MQRIFLYTFLICQPIYAIAEETPVVVWSTPEARQRLMTSVNNDFFQLADRFQPQINPLYCGVASSTIVLNAMRQDSSRAPSQQLLEVKMPKAFGGGAIPFRAYSQLTFLWNENGTFCFSSAGIIFIPPKRQEQQGLRELDTSTVS